MDLLESIVGELRNQNKVDVWIWKLLRGSQITTIPPQKTVRASTVVSPAQRIHEDAEYSRMLHGTTQLGLSKDQGRSDFSSEISAFRKDTGHLVNIVFSVLGSGGGAFMLSYAGAASSIATVRGSQGVS